MFKQDCHLLFLQITGRTLIHLYSNMSYQETQNSSDDFLPGDFRGEENAAFLYICLIA